MAKALQTYIPKYNTRRNRRIMAQAELDSLHIVKLNETIEQYREFSDTLHSALLASFDKNIEVCRVCTEATKTVTNAWMWSIIVLVAVLSSLVL